MGRGGGGPNHDFLPQIVIHVRVFHGISESHLLYCQHGKWSSQITLLYSTLLYLVQHFLRPI